MLLVIYLHFAGNVEAEKVELRVVSIFMIKQCLLLRNVLDF